MAGSAHADKLHGVKTPVPLAAVLLALSFSTPLAAAQSSSSSAPAPVIDTVTEEHTVRVDGVERRYRLVVPTEGRQPRALIIAFGGRNIPTEMFAGDSRLEVAAGGDAVVVYPEALTGAWEGAPYSTTTRGQDVDFTRQLIEDVAARTPIDRERILAVGHSNGGGMVAGLVCQAPELIDAGMIVAGAYYDPTVTGCVEPAGAHPALAVLHSADDGVMSIDGGIRHDAHYYPAQEAFALLAARNGCALEEAKFVTSHPNASTWTPEECVSPTTYTVVSDQRHSWYAEPDVAAIAWGLLTPQDPGALIGLSSSSMS